MTKQCFICDKKVGQWPAEGDDFTVDNFGEYMNLNQTLANLLSDIVDKSKLNLVDLHSNVLCRKCYSTAMEFDKINKRKEQIKNEMTNNFKSTLSKHGFMYPIYPFKTTFKTESPVKANKQIVVPKSKLQPLPPNFVIDITKLPKKDTTPSPKIDVKTALSPKSTSSFNSNQSSPEKTQSVTSKDTVESNIADSLSSILGVKTSTSMTSDMSMLTFNVTDSGERSEDVKREIMTDDNDQNVDDQPMEIDEGTTTAITLDDGHDAFQSVQFKEDGTQYITAQYLSDNDDYDDDDETQTIIMDGGDGSILRLVSGQQLILEGGADSNDESQIELQVSGDEETANAIIAAAQEQGGAFIKVESGEMFRVKSVKSKNSVSGNETEISSNISVSQSEQDGIEQDGSTADMQISNIVAVRENWFACLLCENTKKGNSATPLKKADKVLTYDAEEMMQHLRKTHDARVYLCQLCKKIMKKKSEYSAHLAEHSTKLKNMPTEKKAHECNICNKKFSARVQLQDHLNTHNGVRPYTCAVCQKTFASKYTHQAHLKTHLMRPRPWSCSQCSKSFLSAHNLSQHEQTHRGIKNFICTVCNKAFSTQHNLDVHGVVHSGSKPYVCGVCGKAFARRAEIRDHMRTHTGERPFSCDICGAAFSQRSNLHSHKRATHFNDRRYHCNDCPKKFKRRRLLEFHIQAAHTGERPLQCEICHATFVYPEHAKKHARIHSGDKPFACEVCGKTFNSRDNRNTHRFTHSDKKPYECLVCGTGYMRKQLLYAHMNTCNHLAESIVVNQPRVKKETKSKKPIMQKTTTELPQPEPQAQEKSINLIPEMPIVQEADGSALLTLIQSMAAEQQNEGNGDALQPIQVVTTDDTGAIRLVQLNLNATATWTLAE